MVQPLLVLALEFHRAPLRFRHLTDPHRPLPQAFGGWLTESSAALAPGKVEATAEALGTAPEALRDAYRFLLRQILLVPQADHYRVLGLSRRCSPESIKQHRGLLVRLFHPDHLPENDERSVSLTVRINAAYQVLRDPQARRRYDSRLPPLPPGERSHDDPSDFFRPHGSVASVSGRTRTPSALPLRGRSVLLWTLVCFVMMALVYLVAREPRQPMLRVNPELAGGTAQDPPYLHGGEGPRATIEPPGQAGGEPSPRSNQGSLPTILDIRERPRDTAPQHADREPRGEVTPTQAVSELVSRLERSFANGDLAGLVSLFTANAVVNDGVGAMAVGNAYSDMLGQAGQGRMTLSGLTWRTGQHERLLGQGAIRISTRRGPQLDWSDASGTVEIELVPWMGDYRISKLIHHLARK
jgi:hypothetical protein